jgi:FMN-dependent NADH-azoreductase
MKVLRIDSSTLGERSASRALTQRVVDNITAQHPDVQLMERDLEREPLPQLSGAALGGDALATAEWAARSDALIAELKSADMVVIGVPLYNFGVPASLKTWIDHVSAAGKTFKYSANGVEGLVPDKPVILVGTAGGVHASTSVHHSHTGYVEHVLHFLGVKDVRTVEVEGLAIPELRDKALQRAQQRIDHELLSQRAA